METMLIDFFKPELKTDECRFRLRRMITGQEGICIVKELVRMRPFDLPYVDLQPPLISDDRKGDERREFQLGGALRPLSATFPIGD